MGDRYSSRRRTAPLLGIQTHGYRSKSLSADILLGTVFGLDNVLWSYTFASLIFVDALSAYLPLGIALLLVSGAIVGTTVALTSKIPVHVVSAEEGVVAVLGTVAVAMNARMAEFASADSAATTIIAIMALATLLIGLSFLLVARFNLGLLIQLTPFPVVCGFLAGIGWLFFTAGISMTIGKDVEIYAIDAVLTPDALSHWLPALGCGLAIHLLLRRVDHSLALPVSLLVCALGFFLASTMHGVSLQTLRAEGWLFDVSSRAQPKGLHDLAFFAINWPFVVSVLPQIAAMVVISLLTASFSFSALELGLGESLDFNHELASHGLANVLGALCLGLAGSTEAPPTILGHRTGGGSRILPLAACALFLVAAAFGPSFVAFIPKIAIGALAFVAALQLIHEYLIETARLMNALDSAIVWLIFGVIVFVGFIPGVAAGLILMTLLFIVRYSKIDIVASAYSLNQIASSVERARPERQVLRQFGNSVRLFNLRGFLFFGTANMLFERMKTICEQSTPDSYFIFNFRRVNGIDSTAAQVFGKIVNLLESRKIMPVFCALDQGAAKAFAVAGLLEGNTRLVLADPDLALKWVEERILADRAAPDPRSSTVVAILEDMIGDHDKAEKLASIMERVSLDEGQYLFRQGDVETTAYVIQSGTVEIRLETDDGRLIRLREFRRCAFVGEMAAYSTNRRRSGSAIAIEPSVLYRVDGERLKALCNAELEAAMHELMARLLTSRLEFMNERTRADL
jgi:SulP family sulfate permease